MRVLLVEDDTLLNEVPLADLVDNALRHAPPDSRVTLRFVLLSESDSPGSGLGLAIMQKVAQGHGAQVVVGDVQGGHGTRVRVRVRVAFRAGWARM